MRTLFSRGLALALSSLLAGGCALAQSRPATPASFSTTSKADQQRAASAFAALPLGFEPNRGQSAAATQFVAQTPQSTVYLSGPDAVLQTAKFAVGAHGSVRLKGSDAVRMHLVGATEAPATVTGGELPGRVNYLLGNDRSQWHTGLPRYSSVSMGDVYPGIGLKYYGNGSTLEYDFNVAAGADAAQIHIAFQGATATLSNEGDLLLPQGNGSPLRFAKPVAYQLAGEVRQPVDAAFEIAADKTVSFKLGSYDHGRELVIDPTLVFLGTLGTGTYPAHTNLGQITVDSAGEMFFIGTTNDANFPVTANAYQKVCGPTKGDSGQVQYYGGYCPSGGGGEQAAYVAKLSADGTKLVYATYLSGKSGTETGGAITVDSAGVAYLLGTTGSDDFPVTSDAFQKNCVSYYGVFGGPNDVKCDGYYNGGGTEYTINNQIVFFSKLSADGSSLLYSSFLGGTLPVYPNTIAVDASGNMYLSGQVGVMSAAQLAPCANGYNQGCQPGIQFPGITSSGYLTIANATDSNGNAGSGINAAAFLSKFSNDGHTLLYGTFFADNSTGVDVLPTTMTVGANGIAFLGGYTQAVNYPTSAGAVKANCTQAQTGYGGRYCNTYDGYLAAIDTTKAGTASLAYSTRIGGAATSQGSNIAINEVLGMTADSSNNAYVTGYTFDSTFNAGTGGFQSACPNNTGNAAPGSSGYYDRCDSAFLLKINPTGTKILAGTFLGGPDLRSAESVGYNVRLDSKGQIYLYGRSNDGGGDFPQVNPLQPYKGGNQLFVSAFTPDLTKLLFSTRFGNPAYTDHSVTVAGGMALDGSDNIYFAGTTTDSTFGTTTGTYATPGPTGDVHAFFAKLSKVLQPTTATLTVSPNPANQGNTVTYKAVVAGLYQTTPAATGMVTFMFTSTTPATTVGTATLDATGTATLTAAAPASGAYTVTATYGADATYDVSTSVAATLTVSSKAATATTVLSSAPTAITGAPVMFTASVESSVTSTNTPSGTVTFYDGNPAAGGMSIGMGPLAGGKATATVSTLAVSTHTVYAVYAGDANFVSSTGNTTELITAKSATTTTLSSTAATSASGIGVTLTATVTGATAGSPTGTVTFLEGTTSLGTGTLTGGTASFTTSSLAVGTHMITASYAGDAMYLASTSAVFTQTVTAASVAIAVAPTSLTITHGSSGTATITATPTGAYSGTLTFSCGTLPANATCTFAPASLVFSASATAQTSTLTISTTAQHALLEGMPFVGNATRVVAAALFLPAGLLGLFLRRRGLNGAGLLLLMLGAGAAGLTGCGGSNTPAAATTPVGSYTVPVVATVNGTSTSVNLAVTVQ